MNNQDINNEYLKNLNELKAVLESNESRKEKVFTSIEEVLNLLNEKNLPIRNVLYILREAYRKIEDESNDKIYIKTNNTLFAGEDFNKI